MTDLTTEFDDQDEFTELHDAVIPRVDLVGKGANGVPFLIAKSAGDHRGGLVAKSQVSQLIARGETRHPRRSTPIRKAPTAMAPVYDANGNLVGTVDPAKINEVAQPATDRDKAVARVQANTPPNPALDPDQVTVAANEITKALAGAVLTDGDGRGLIAKSAGTVDQRFQALLQGIDPVRSRRVSDAVAQSALKLAVSKGITGTSAVQISKTMALSSASRLPRRPIEQKDALAEIKRRLGD